MAEDADKPDKPLDENETLVKALESIKSLLATSESKLSQARESISQASAHSLKMTRDVPVLDQVIVPGKPVESTDTDTQPGTSEPQPEPQAEPQADLASFKAALEKEMQEKLAAYVLVLEEELKARIEAYLDQSSK